MLIFRILFCFMGEKKEKGMTEKEIYLNGVKESLNALINYFEREEENGKVVFSKHDLEEVCCNILNIPGKLEELSGISHVWN